MADTFRALCAELADSVELLLEMRSNDRPMRVTEDRLARARAALAQPEPKTSRLRYCDVHGQQPENAWGCPECVREMRHQLAQPEPQGPTDEELDEFAIYWWGSEIDERSVSDVIECGSMAAYARAALARYGRPAIEPVSVSERQPGPEDCDEEGQCWWWDEDDDMWRLSRHRPWLLCWTHWLPHWALPVPAPANTINQNNY
jgi:hypothetical protein